MSTRHIWGVVYRNLIIWVRDLDRVFDAFWWAFFDIVIWGFTSVYLSQGEGNVTGVLISGVILWAVMARAQWEMCASMLMEVWDKNLINMFTSPLTVGEFIVASFLLGVSKLLLVFLFMAGLALLFYQFNVFSLGILLVPLLASLFVTSIWLAFVINALILRYGRSVISFAWTLVLLFHPISGVVYPISVLPEPLQAVARILPTSYVFEAMREALATGHINSSLVLTSFALNVLYTIVGMGWYLYTFKKAREHGWLIKLA